MNLDSEQNVELYGGEQDYDYPSFGQVRQRGISFNNYADKILPNFDHLPPSYRWTIVDILHTNFQKLFFIK